jgi:hypothetical protein
MPETAVLEPLMAAVEEGSAEAVRRACHSPH